MLRPYLSMMKISQIGLSTLVACLRTISECMKPHSDGVAQGHHLGGTTYIILSNCNDMQVHVLPIDATIPRIAVPNS